MPETIISDGQSLVDVALQELGGVAALFDLADASGLGIADLLMPGQVLPVPASAAAVPAVATYYQRGSYRVNTGGLPLPAAPVPPAGGIDFDLTDLSSADFL